MEESKIEQNVRIINCTKKY